MGMLVIFLCVLVASKSVFSDLERRTIDTDESSTVDMAVGADAGEASSSEGKKNNTADQKQRIRDARQNLSDHDVAGRKTAKLILVRSPLVTKPSLVTPSDSKKKKKNMERTIIKELRTSPPNISINQVINKETWANFLKSLLKSVVAITPSRAERNFSNKTGKLLRRKRTYDVNEPYYDSLNEHNLIFKKFPIELKYAIAATNHFEHGLLLGYATSKGSRDYIDSLLSEYIQAKRSERKLLRKLAETEGSRSPQLISNYKALRKGVAWLYVKLTPNLKHFFETPSAFLTEYDILKRDELDTIDSYLDGTLKYDEEIGGKSGKFEKSMAAAEIKKSVQEEEQLMNVKDVDTTRSLSESYEAMREVRRRLPEDLRNLIEVTDKVDEALIDSYSRAQYPSTKILADYYAAKQMERELLKELAADMTASEAKNLISNYKLLRKGRAWNYVKLQDRFKLFFRRPTAPLLEYETLKKDELASIDRFLSDEYHLAGSEKTSVLKTISQAVAHAAKLAEEGRTTYATILRSLPDILSIKILQTDNIEREILSYYAKSESVPKQILDAYDTAKNEERTTLKQLILEHPQEKDTLVNSYKSLRKGVAWKFQQVEQPYAEFFQRSSAALTEYETLKKEELTTLDSFLNGKPRHDKASRKRHVHEETWQAVARAADITKAKLERTAGDSNTASNSFDLETTRSPANVTDETTSAEESNQSTASAAGDIIGQKIFRYALVASVLSQVIIIISILIFYRKHLAEKLFKKKTVALSPAATEKAPLEPTKRASATGSATKTKQVASHILRTAVKDTTANIISEVPKKSKHISTDTTANVAHVSAHPKASKTTHVDSTNVAPVSDPSTTLKTALKDTTATPEGAKVSSKSSLTTLQEAAATPGVVKVSSKHAADILQGSKAPVDVTKGAANRSLIKGNPELPAGDANDVTKK